MGGKIDKNETGGAYSVYGGKREAYTGFWWGNLMEGYHLGDPGIKVGCGGMDWIELAQDRDRCRSLVSTVMNFRFHKMRGIS